MTVWNSVLIKWRNFIGTISYQFDFASRLLWSPLLNCYSQGLMMTSWEAPSPLGCKSVIALLSTHFPLSLVLFGLVSWMLHICKVLATFVSHKVWAMQEYWACSYPLHVSQERQEFSSLGALLGWNHLTRCRSESAEVRTQTLSRSSRARQRI